MSMVEIQRKLDHIKTETVNEKDVAYLRFKAPLFTRKSDLLRLQKNLIICIKKHGAKIPFESYQNLLKMEFVVERELQKFGAPDSFRRDAFRHKDYFERTYF